MYILLTRRSLDSTQYTWTAQIRPAKRSTGAGLDGSVRDVVTRLRSSRGKSAANLKIRLLIDHSYDREQLPLKLDDLLEIIQVNGASEGLTFQFCDLRGLSVGREEIQHARHVFRDTYKAEPRW